MDKLKALFREYTGHESAVADQIKGSGSNRLYFRLSDGIVGVIGKDLEENKAFIALDAHFAASTDPLEGYWQYLDRDMDDNILRLGGRYVVALVQAGDGYDIIYVNGAQVKRQQWTTGLWKGHLKKTAFIDNYTATWVDATFLPITDDVYATFDNAVILTLRFPVFRSQLRLAKVVDF